MSEPSGPTTFQANATRIVGLLMVLRGVSSAQQLGDATGIPKGRLRDRLAGRAAWDLDELDDLARFFGARLSVFAYEAESLLSKRPKVCVTCGQRHR